jgi:hypothetical protein
LTLRECSGVGRPGRTFRFGLDLTPLLAQRARHAMEGKAEVTWTSQSERD